MPVIEAGVASSTAVNELACTMESATGETASAMAEIATITRQTHDSAERQTESAAEAAAAAARVGEGLAECGARAASGFGAPVEGAWGFASGMLPQNQFFLPSIAAESIPK